MSEPKLMNHDTNIKLTMNPLFQIYLEMIIINNVMKSSKIICGVPPIWRCSDMPDTE